MGDLHAEAFCTHELARVAPKGTTGAGDEAGGKSHTPKPNPVRSQALWGRWVQSVCEG